MSRTVSTADAQAPYTVEYTDPERGVPFEQRASGFPDLLKARDFYTWAQHRGAFCLSRIRDARGRLVVITQNGRKNRG